MPLLAKGTFKVDLKPAEPQGAEAESGLGRMSIDKRIEGDLVATTRGQMLSAMTETKGSAGYVAMERVSGELHGRKGTFVLQHTGTMNRGAASAAITVVPDSGTDGLTGVSGDFRIVIQDGGHSYEFEYTLPAAD